MLTFVILLDVFIGYMGAGIGIGRIGGSAVEAMARQPEISEELRANMIVAAALVEGAVFFAIIICFIIIFK